MTKASIYARVSTNRQETENQIIELKDFIQGKEWELYEVYEDSDVKGDEEKPQLERLFQDAHQGKFNIIVFWAWDRITRKGPQDAFAILLKMESLGIDFWSYREQYMNTLGPWRDVVLSIITTIAAEETKRISERVKAGLKRALKEGKTLGRPQRDDVTAREVIIFREEGMSWPQMSKRLGVPQSTLRNIYKRGLPKTLSENDNNSRLAEGLKPGLPKSCDLDKGDGNP